MATTYTLIDKSILTGTQANVEFTSIPSTYTDLVLQVSARSSYADTDDSFRVYFNDDTSASNLELRGSGSAVASYTNAYAQVGYLDAANNTSNTFTSSSIYIPNYASSNYKSFSADTVQEQNGTAAFAVLTARLWSSTSAITKITMKPSLGSFVANSSFYLYGIKNS